MNNAIHEQLTKRLGLNKLAKRLKQQKLHTALQFRHGFRLYWENLDWLVPSVYFCLKATHLLQRSMRNSLDFKIIKQTVILKNLPKTFNDFTILHLSDLHIEGMIDYGKKLIQQIKNLKYDLCVITGDFRFLTYGQTHECITHLKHLVKNISCRDGILGVLGNHDPIEMVPQIEAIGIKILLNESTQIKRGTDHKSFLGIAGVDDSHFYYTDDLKTAKKNIEDIPCKILLAHSQELIARAAKFKFDFYLCGHTHGGQLCLPGGIPVIHNTPHPYGGPFTAGPWKYHDMPGYTSRGAGTSGLPARLNCPPEITLHTLKMPST